jgi:polyisoprenoid-binding protein YceI
LHLTLTTKTTVMNKAYNLLLGIGVSAALIACGGSANKESKESAEKTDKEAKKEMSMEVKEVSITPGESKVMWSGEVFGVYTHNGTVDVIDGMLKMKGDQITGGNFSVDLTTMKATDDNYNPEEGKSKEKLIGHLSSADFFMVDSFPKSTFEITSVDAAKNTLTGNLTIRGVTNEETVENVMVDTEAGTASGKLVFDRKKYDVAFTHPAEDVVIADDVELEVKLKM